MKVVIAGSSGLIGTALKDSLRGDDHTVVSLVRREARRPHESSWDPASGVVDREVLASADVVVNLAGASIGAKRLTDSHAKLVLQSRLDSTGTIVRALVDAGFAGLLLQGSAMGYYGDRGEDHLTERSGPGDTLLASIVRQWEAAAQPAVDAGIRTVFARTGLVLAPHGGFAERLMPLVTRGLLRSLGKGTAWHSWISLEDHIRALRFLIESDHHGPANVIAPIAVRDRELIRAMSEAAGRSPGLPVPGWALRIAIGRAIEDLLSSQLASPGVLKRLDFSWRHPEITGAAQWVMAEAGHAPPTSARPT
ncbi:TIGR01777 family oxidoreductase [Demequina muriae]|uniref:TIGR01777 family oxidoreductase n=1 Tax=Demequina muriae TaxID=3051664 RepID=A0ABT8GJD5_9MICO|nr:TIGR01777 family oxidoreductase [Demequina sp. EGI L300058]MDN4481537.1 TIGR01777 family oxidoreductase [Demequina sp. EGI L300058]